MKYLSFLLLILISLPSSSQELFSGKVFQSGSSTDFGNPVKCQFYFECDCCYGEIIFKNDLQFLMINYCLSDFVLSKGNYVVQGDKITLISDDSRVDKKYNWEREIDTSATPIYFYEKSKIDPFFISYTISDCDGILLTEMKDGKSLAKESSDNVDELMKELAENNLLEN